MIQVTELAYTAYPVTNLSRARAFYEGLLGLKPAMVHGPDDAAWIEYEIGPGVLAISNMMPDWKPSRQGPGAALEVADFEAAIQTLRQHGIPFYFEPFDSPVCRMAVVSDPDGNSVTIHKRK